MDSLVEYKRVYNRVSLCVYMFVRGPACRYAVAAAACCREEASGSSPAPWLPPIEPAPEASVISPDPEKRELAPWAKS